MVFVFYHLEESGKGDNGGKKGKGHQGTCIKDPWTKPKGSRTEGGIWWWVGCGRWRGK